MKVRNWVAAAVLLATTHGAIAGSEEGLAAYEKGDYLAALRAWRPLAEQGDADAQFNLGFMHYSGQGTPRDYARALKWYRAAAEQGDSDAQFNLRNMYRDGEGTWRDDQEAIKWFRAAAEQGDAEAQYKLLGVVEEAISPRAVRALRFPLNSDVILRARVRNRMLARHHRCP